MTKTKIIHQNTEIYKIVCNDPEVKHLYVGSTTNFVKRKSHHKRNVNNPKNNFKIYKIIRENGGWDNWKMLLVEKYPCSSKREAEAREEEIRIQLQATMNTYRCFIPNNGICLYQDCCNGARGATGYCKKHRGGKRCLYQDCDKSAQGATDYCKKHGGGKRCVYQDCDKSSIGATDYCKKHGVQIECECGSIVSEKSLKGHYKTKKHIEYSKRIIKE